MDGIYEGFVGRVAAGRKMPVTRVREIAKGRVWTGAQAQGLGLVDQIGGFYDAVDQAKRLAGLHGEARLKSINAEASPFDAVRRMFGGASESARIAGTLADLAADPAARAMAGQISDARLRAEGATVLAPRWVR
jgi:protease-4